MVHDISKKVSTFATMHYIIHTRRSAGTITKSTIDEKNDNPDYIASAAVFLTIS